MFRNFAGNPQNLANLVCFMGALFKVTLRPTEAFHGIRNRVHHAYKRPESIFNLDAQLEYRLLSYVLLDDISQSK